MPDVFISYNREDREIAGLVANALEAEGFSVWWDAALRAGETYDEVTELNLRSAGAVVVLWSKRSSNSKWVRAEATVGERSSTLVPALIEDCERPIRFELVQTADLRHWRGDRSDPHWRAFMQDVRTAVRRRGADASPGTTPTGSSQNVTIETTFWNSIKNGTDPSDFEAYLKRYPSGFFATIAQNRLALLARSTSPDLAPTPPAQSRAATSPAPKPRAAPPLAKPERDRGSTPKKSAGGLIAAIGILLVIVAGAVAFLATRSGDKTAGTILPPEPATPPVVVADTDNPSSAGSVEDFAMVGTEVEELVVDASLDEGEPVDKTAVVTAEEAASEPVAEQSIPVVGGVFRDCDSCPLMVTLPAGQFVMGSPSSEAGRNAYEGPQREVSVKSFAIGVYEVTNAEWNACVASGACKEKRSDDGDAFPALYLSWRDASGYAAWLSKKTGRRYRLPTEAEWEYAARAGSTTAYWWGDKFQRSMVTNNGAAPVGALTANAFGIYDVAGNAREWVADCYVNNFATVPTDGAAVVDGDCGRRVIRGGSWESAPTDTRIANRSRIGIDVAARYTGARLAADIE